MATQPDYKVSDSVKQTKDWYINAIDWLISKAVNSNNKALTVDAINVANGIIDTSEFKKVMQPFGNAPEELKNLPGTIRKVDFITPVREKNMGEYISLPYKYFVTVENPDVAMKRDAQVAEAVYKQLQEELIKFVESLQQGQPPQEIDPKIIKDKVDKLKQQLFDDEVIQAQHVLDFINESNNFDYFRYNAFSDWWMTQEVYTYRYIKNGELFKELLDVANSYPIVNNSDFVEDYDGFAYKQRITFQEFEQNYSDRLSAEDQKYLKAFNYNANTGQYSVPVNILYERGNLDNITYHTDGNQMYTIGSESMDLWRVWFIAPSPVKELKYVDEMNRVQYMHVDKNYILNPENGDIELTNIWIPKVYQCERFGAERTGVYTKPELSTVQRYDRRSNTAKLPVGGKKGLLRGLPLNPIPLRLKDYAILDTILLLAIERSVAKFRPDLLTIPQVLLNSDKAGTAQQKYQHMMADDTLIFDETKIKDMSVLTNGLRSLGRTNIANYIDALDKLRTRNRLEALDVANMNQERLGNANGNQTLGTTENNLAYAKLGSILMLTVFNKMLEKDHMADLEFSKYAFINGKQATYFDRQTESYIELNVDPEQLFYDRHTIAVSNSEVDKTIMEQFKNIAFSAGQNGEFDIASIAITATTPKQIARTLNDLADAKRTFEQSIKEQELAEMKRTNDIAERQLQLSEKKEVEENATDIQVAQISAGSKIQAASISGNRSK
jgi:hypothetical protein